MSEDEQVRKSCETCFHRTTCTLIKGHSYSVLPILDSGYKGSRFPSTIPAKLLPMPCGGRAWKQEIAPSARPRRFFEDYAPPRPAPKQEGERTGLDWVPNESGLPE